MPFLQRRTAVTLAAILAVAGALRFAGLAREGLWGDEYIQVTEYRLPLLYTALQAIRHHALGPLDFLVGWVVHRISPTVAAYRLPAATFGVCAIAACFLLVRRLISVQAALLAAAMLCLCRMHILLSQEVRPYSLAVLLILTTLILLLRAFENPTRGRILAYGLALFSVPLSRSFTGVMLQFSLAAVLTLAFMKARRDRSADSPAPTLKRLWLATIVACLATLPMFAYIVYSQRVYTVLPSGYKQNLWETTGTFGDKLLHNLSVMADALYASFGPVVLLLAAIGIVHLLRRWRGLTLPVRCSFSAMLILGPAYLLVFTAMVRYQTIFHRYTFFLMPIVAVFSSAATHAALTWLAAVLQRNHNTRRLATATLVAGLLAYPAVMAAEEKRSFRRLDWRGCVTALDDQITSDDVILVLSDRPFGRPQITFRGKADWPRKRRPLAESFWTFAVSDSHFERLTRRTGRVYIVITYLIEPQSADAYLARGLQSAPPGHRLRKFRGLDLLIPESPAGRTLEDVRRACDTLLALPREHESANATILALKSRLLAVRTSVFSLQSPHVTHYSRPSSLPSSLFPDDSSRMTLRTARALVPPEHLNFFDRMTASWSIR